MNFTKLLKISIGAIVGFFVALIILGALIPDQEPAHNLTSPAQVAASPTVKVTASTQDAEWISTSAAYGLELGGYVQDFSTLMSNFDAANYDILLQKILLINGVSNKAYTDSKSMSVGPDLEEAKTQFESMAYNYRAFSASFISGFSMLSKGEQTAGEAKLREGMEYLDDGVKNYSSYATEIGNYAKTHTF